MNRIINSGLLIFILILSSCSTNIKLEDYIDITASFAMNSKSSNSETGLTESKSSTLEANSEKWEKMIDWTSNNQDGWTSSSASHIGDIYVLQGDFRLIYIKGSLGVVIAFKDKAGNSKQYMKGIEEGELNFLYE